MYASILPVTVLVLLLWLPPSGWSAGALTAYLAVCVVGVRFFDTLFELPHLALIPELTSDYNERTRLFTIRYIFEAGGGVLVTALAYNVFLVERSDGTGGLLSAQGYPAFALFAALMIFSTQLACTAGLHRRLVCFIQPPVIRMSFRTHLGEVAAALNSRSFAVLALAAVFISLGSGMGSAMATYWLLYFYGFSQAEMTALIVPVLLGVLATGLTPSISSRLGKRNTAVVLLWVYGLATSVPLLARLLELVPAHSSLLLLLVAIQGVIGAAAMTMVMISFSSMISDLVEEAEVRTGRRAEGLLLAANSFVRKATQGLGTLGAGVILTLVAFPQGAERTQVPAGVLENMAWTYLGVSVLLCVLTTVVLSFYRYTRATHEQNLRTLRGRGAQPQPFP